jgi:hypothetical protein
MLGWQQLTHGQRIGGTFLLILFVIASPMMILLESHIANQVWDAGLAAIGLGVIFDPQWFRISYSALPNVAAIPNLCRALLCLGCLMAVIGFVMRHMHIGGSS